MLPPTTDDPAMSTTLDGVAHEGLAVFLAALETGSLNRAARHLRIGQATASRRLARLEEQLGARLFDRTPEGLLPTELAHQLTPHARLVEEHMADIARLAGGHEATPQGRIRLALPDGLGTAFVLPRIGEFFARYPEVDVDLRVGHAVVDLVRREADLALRFVRPTKGDLLVQKLGVVPIAPFVHPSLAGADPRSLRWIMFDDPDEVFVETRWVRQHVQPAHWMEVSVGAGLFEGARLGLGPALLSPLVAEPAGLVPIPGLPPVPGRELYLVCHRALRTVPRIAVFRDWLADLARDFLA